ncbi:MAG: tetratricopeptide repeat protein [Geminicoccaceae bacterium]
MDNRNVTRFLTIVAVGLGVLFIGWAVYDRIATGEPGDAAYLEGNTLFEDGAYERAIQAYERSLEQAPDHIFALRGLARAKHKAGYYDEALNDYNEAVEREPEFGATIANRGILLDTMGRHEEALSDYLKALSMDQELAEGPHWMTRFLRNQAEAPPSVADRARYLQEQFALPAEQRLLRLPEEDADQRPYKR